jgi:hypothetical protein
MIGAYQEAYRIVDALEGEWDRVTAAMLHDGLDSYAIALYPNAYRNSYIHVQVYEDGKGGSDQRVVIALSHNHSDMTTYRYGSEEVVDELRRLLRSGITSTFDDPS